MATAPTLPLVSVDEYLNSGYHPDMDYVDGVLVERTVPTLPHSVLQMLLIRFFAEFERAMRFLTLPEVRTQIIECARYRVPDILLCPIPLPQSRVVNVTPLAVIEILSPDDKMGETLERLRDYESIGIPAIVQMDPENCVAHRFENGSLIETHFRHLHISETAEPIPFDSTLLFSQLRENLGL